MAAFTRLLRPLVFAPLLCLLLLAGCESAGVATPVPTTITIGGATAMRRVLEELTAEFSRQHPDVLFVVRGGGSTIGEELARRRELDLGASTLFPPVAQGGVAGAQAGAAEAQGDGTAGEGSAGVQAGGAAGQGGGARVQTADPLVRTPIGLDALALVAHPSNSVSGLSLVQLRDIFSGSLLDWAALGSDAGEIQLVSREDGSGARTLFETRVMGDARVALTAIVMPSSRDVVEYVAKNPQAIGYVSRSEVAEWIAGDSAAADPNVPPAVKVLPVEGRLPTHASVRSQEYALTQPLYFVSYGQPAGRLRQFVDFVLSPAGQAIVDRYSVRIR